MLEETRSNYMLKQGTVQSKVLNSTTCYFKRKLFLVKQSGRINVYIWRNERKPSQLTVELVLTGRETSYRVPWILAKNPGFSPCFLRVHADVVAKMRRKSSKLLDWLWKYAQTKDNNRFESCWFFKTCWSILYSNSCVQHHDQQHGYL